MTVRNVRALVLVALAGILAACENTKSSNPLSPSVAGPIEGVLISAPKLVSPAAGQRIAVADQPVSLTVENATTTGPRPLKYLFEIAADAGFTNTLFSRQDVQPGTDGRTSLKLTDTLSAGRTYYWRAMALDGANSGPYGVAAHFEVYTPVVLQAPVQVSPVDGVTLTGLRPAFRVTNVARSGTPGPLSYIFQVAESVAFPAVVINATVSEQANETGYSATVDLLPSKTYYWRVRALDSSVTSPWSATRTFKTPAAGSPTPTPGPIGSADQIVASQITWLEAASANVSGWAVTSQVTEVVQSGDQVCLYHTKAGEWPLAEPFGPGTIGIEGTFMIVAQFGGKWYGAAFDWMPGGRTCKNLTADEYGRDQVRVAPMDASWPGPKAGDRIGLLITTPASNRIPVRTVNERTNIVVITWK